MQASIDFKGTHSLGDHSGFAVPVLLCSVRAVAVPIYTSLVWNSDTESKAFILYAHTMEKGGIRNIVSPPFLEHEPLPCARYLPFDRPISVHDITRGCRYSVLTVVTVLSKVSTAINNI